MENENQETQAAAEAPAAAPEASAPDLNAELEKLKTILVEKDSQIEKLEIQTQQPAAAPAPAPEPAPGPTAAQVEAVEKRLEGVESRFVAVGLKITEIAERLSSAEKAPASAIPADLNDRTRALEQRLDRMDVEFTAIGAKLDSMSEKIQQALASAPINSDAPPAASIATPAPAPILSIPPVLTPVPMSAPPSLSAPPVLEPVPVLPIESGHTIPPRRAPQGPELVPEPALGAAHDPAIAASPEPIGTPLSERTLREEPPHVEAPQEVLALQDLSPASSADIPARLSPFPPAVKAKAAGGSPKKVLAFALLAIGGALAFWQFGGSPAPKPEEPVSSLPPAMPMTPSEPVAPEPPPLPPPAPAPKPMEPTPAPAPPPAAAKPAKKKAVSAKKSSSASRKSAARKPAKKPRRRLVLPD